MPRPWPQSAGPVSCTGRKRCESLSDGPFLLVAQDTGLAKEAFQVASGRNVVAAAAASKTPNTLVGGAPMGHKSWL